VGSFSDFFPTKSLYTPLLSPTYFIPHPYHSSRFNHQNIIGRGANLVKKKNKQIKKRINNLTDHCYRP
jgi:hypothetical protein